MDEKRLVLLYAFLTNLLAVVTPQVSRRDYGRILVTRDTVAAHLGRKPTAVEMVAAEDMLAALDAMCVRAEDLDAHGETPSEDGPLDPRMDSGPRFPRLPMPEPTADEDSGV